MNWKTTLSGIVFVGALCGFLAGQTETLKIIAPLKDVLLLVSMISGFINAYHQKDKDVTGGNR